MNIDCLMNTVYKHFETVEECDRYAEHHEYTYRCCGGKGICLKKPEKTLKRTDMQKRTQDDCCCVCLEKTDTLTSCGHLVCAGCMERVRPICPYCRQTMT